MKIIIFQLVGKRTVFHWIFKKNWESTHFQIKGSYLNLNLICLVFNKHSHTCKFVTYIYNITIGALFSIYWSTMCCTVIFKLVLYIKYLIFNNYSCRLYLCCLLYRHMYINDIINKILVLHLIIDVDDPCAIYYTDIDRNP